jgi:hypothetical protein
VAVGRQFEGHGNCVKKPSQDQLSGFPVGVTLGQLFDGGRFAARRGIVGIYGTEHLVDHVEEGAEDF